MEQIYKKIVSKICLIFNFGYCQQLGLVLATVAKYKLPYIVIGTDTATMEIKTLYFNVISFFLTNILIF